MPTALAIRLSPSRAEWSRKQLLSFRQLNHLEPLGTRENLFPPFLSVLHLIRYAIEVEDAVSEENPIF